MLKNITGKNFISEVFDKYYKEIYNFVFVRVRYRKEVAEDLTQDIFLKIFKYREGYDHEKSSIRTWIYRIAKNRVIDWYRKQKDIVNFDEKTIKSDMDNLEDEALIEFIVRSFEKLTENDKELVQLRYIQELSIKEIADLLDKNESAVKVALHRAIKNLKKIINGQS